MLLKLSGLLFLVVTLASCSGKYSGDNGAEDSVDSIGATYFSMRDFVRDQWNINKGQPYTFIKIVTKNGKKDSTMVSAFKMELGDIMEKFVKTDIGERKFLGKYSFSMIDDSLSATRSYYYEANEPELYTRKLQIITNPNNNFIKSIFIEAAEKKGWERTAVKLYYAPNKIIQIQEHIESRTGSSDDIKTEYIFPGLEGV